MLLTDCYHSKVVCDAASLVPLNLALHVLDLLELVSQLHDGEIDHTGIETKGTTNRCLDGTGRIETHDEVMAFAIAGLVLGGDLRQAKDAPVGVATDDTTGADDLGTGVAGDSEEYVRSDEGRKTVFGKVLQLCHVLANLVEAARADLQGEAQTSVKSVSIQNKPIRNTGHVQ